VVLLFVLAACGPTATEAPKPASTNAPSSPTTGATTGAVQQQPTAAVATSAPGKKTVLRLPESSKIPQTIDPGITSGSGGLEQVQNFFEGLVYVDQVSGEIKPGQAEKWSISADGLTYTFNLRANLKWSDGQPLKASDFEYAWKRVTDPTTKSRYAQALWPIKGAEAFGSGKGTADGMMVKATDDRTLVVTLERSAPYFLQLAATWSAYPVRKDLIEKFGDKWTLTKESYIGNGHYRMVEWKQEQSMTAEKNPNYWGENNGPDQIIWTLYDSPTTKAIIAYEAGELDHAQLVGPDIPRIKADPKLSKEVKKWERQGTQWIVMDTTNAPLDKVKVRQALTWATNAKQINEVVLKDAYFNAVSIVAPGIAGQKKDNSIGYDVAKAKQFMSEAGYPEGKGWPANVKMVINADDPNEKAIGEAVQAMWKQALGIDITLEPMETKAWDAWRESRTNQPFHFYIQGWGSDYEDPNNWYNLLFHSKADFYHTHWKSAQFDQLVDSGLQENDQTKRKGIYEQADKIMSDEAPFIPIYHWARFTVTKPNIQGLTRYRVLGRVQGYLVRVSPQ
ncbi:MAG: peptide ABC transporter substrate-binding protein, partial [Chloroflexi bacterium]|nr:peptide ABC transporter substrate-binding protein [Chloroflexota bacterium]